MKELPQVRSALRNAAPVILGASLFLTACKGDEPSNLPQLSSVSTTRENSALPDGWVRFTSQDMPYQIDYPSSWHHSVVKADWGNGTTEDHFFKDYAIPEYATPGVVVAAKLSDETLESAAIDYVSKFVLPPSETIVNNPSGERIETGTIWKQKPYRIVYTPNLQVDGRTAWKVEYIIYEQQANYDGRRLTPTMTTITYLILQDGHLWTIEFSQKASQPENTAATLQMMLDSFTFLK